MWWVGQRRAPPPPNPPQPLALPPQIRTVRLADPADCGSKFASNAVLGGVVGAAIVAGRIASGG